ncbi:hypothetical protein B296_00052313, partial [Ensete ventricosum]
SHADAVTAVTVLPRPVLYPCRLTPSSCGSLPSIQKRGDRDRAAQPHPTANARRAPRATAAPRATWPQIKPGNQTLIDVIFLTLPSSFRYTHYASTA